MTDIRIELTPEANRVLNRIDTSWRRDEVFESIDSLFGVESAKVANYAQRKFLVGQRLRRRTGRLAGSVIGQSFRINGVPAMAVGIFKGPAVQYAAVQEFGTKGKGGLLPTIRPKRAKALAIPQGKALTPSGVPKYASPRDYPGELKFIPVLRGHLIGILVDKTEAEAAEEGAEPEALFNLVRKVDIAPKHYLRDAMLGRLPAISAALSDRLVRHLDGGGRIAG